MRITEVKAEKPGILYVVSGDGRRGRFDLKPFLKSEAFRPLSEWGEFSSVRTGGYFVEWHCGADLSADTIEARWSLC